MAQLQTASESASRDVEASDTAVPPEFANTGSVGDDDEKRVLREQVAALQQQVALQARQLAESDAEASDTVAQETVRSEGSTRENELCV